MKKENPVHKLLTTLIAKKQKFSLMYENRPNNITITNDKIVRVLKGSFVIESSPNRTWSPRLQSYISTTDEETQIPFHRIMGIFGDEQPVNILYLATDGKRYDHELRRMIVEAERK